jgi:hypothetical protein
MMIVPVNPNCLCGHGKEAHEYSMAPRCAILIHKRNKLTADRCGCQEFKLDNLKYLELMEKMNGY